MDANIGRRVGIYGSQNSPKGEFSFPSAVVWGPNGIKRMIEVLSETAFEEQEDAKEKTWKIELNNSKYLAVFGMANGIKSRKNGNFLVQSVVFSIKQKKKKGILQETSNVKLEYSVIVRGQLKKADGTFAWLNETQ